MRGHGAFHRAQNVAIIKLRQAARQAALDADFGRAQFPGFDGFLRDLSSSDEEVSVGLARAAAEGAELASHKADVGEIDVAIYDVGDDVADKLGPQQVRRRQQAEQIVAFGVGQRVRILPATSRRRSAFPAPFPAKTAAPDSCAGRVSPLQRGKAFQFRRRKFAGHAIPRRDLAGYVFACSGKSAGVGKDVASNVSTV